MKRSGPGGTTSLNDALLPLKSAQTPAVPYADRRLALIAQIRNGGTAAIDLDGDTLGTLAVEEAFDLMNQTIFGRGLEEESQTAALMSALAAGARFWAPWLGGGDNEVAWLHVSKHDEGKLGVDFALVFALDTCYRICIGQAKRIGSTGDARVNVSQPTSLANENPNADDVLGSLLLGAAPPIQPLGKQYQLTKLLQLKRKLNNADIRMLYALWPDAGGEPLYRPLRSVHTELAAAHCATGGSAVSQYIGIKPKLKLRRLLLGYADPAQTGGLMAATAVKDALETITRYCASTAVIDVGTKGLGIKLIKDLGWTSTQALPALGTATKGLVPGS
jgi:hypothetical protein